MDSVKYSTRLFVQVKMKQSNQRTIKIVPFSTLN